MVNLNTHGRCLRPNLFSELALKVFPRLSGALKGGLMVTLLLCCFSQGTLMGQCNIAYTSPPMPGDPGEINLSLGFTGNVQLNSNVFIGQVSSPNCPGGTIKIWTTSAASTLFPPTNYNCADEGDVVTVWVTIESPLSQSNAIEFEVTIVDDVDPVVICPTDINMPADDGLCTFAVTGLEPSVTDNCASTTVTWVRLPGGSTAGSGSGNADGNYNVGFTEVEFTVNDGNGNIVVCTTEVLILDDQFPEFFTPLQGDETILNDPGLCGSNTFTFDAPPVSDNCGIASYILTADFPDPNPTQTVDITGIAGTGGPINCSPCPIGTTTITLTITDVWGNVKTGSFDLTVKDMEDPVWDPLAPLAQSGSPATCEDYFNLDYSGYISDNCSIVDLTFVVVPQGASPVPVLDVMDGTGADASGTYSVGVYEITFTAEDEAGNPSSITVTFTVSDNVAPVAICTNITVQLDGNGDVTVDAEELDNGSTDNCQVVEFYFYDGGYNGVTTLDFDCSDIAGNPHVVEIYVSDGTNNSLPCSAQITVEDNVLPSAQCQDVSVVLPPDGTGTVSAAQIDFGSDDNCGVASISMAPTPAPSLLTSFSHTGVSQVYVVPPGVTSIIVRSYGAQGSAGDGPGGGAGGLGGYAEGVLTVTPGQMLQINVGGQGSIVAGGFNGGANGGVTSGGGGGGASDVRTGAFGLGDRVIVAGGGGGGGGTGCVAVINGGSGGTGGGGAGANGMDAPTSGGVAGAGFGGTVGAGGLAGIGCGGFLGAPGNINGAGGDGQSCCCIRTPSGGGGGGGLQVGGGGGGGSAGTTGCSGNDKGAGGGGAGGTSSTFALTDALTMNGVQAGNGLVEFYIENQFTCADVGANTVTLTVTDVNGNMNTCTATVTVIDATDPVADGMDLIAVLDASGEVVVCGTDIDDASTDNCGIVEYLIAREDPMNLGNPGTFSTCLTFECDDDLGANLVWLQVEDGSGNTDIDGPYTLTIQDNIAAVPMCPSSPIQFFLDAGGDVDVDAAIVGAASTDNCDITVYEIRKVFINPAGFGPWLSTQPYDCGDIGFNTVRLRVQDASGNPVLGAGTLCTGLIEIVDDINPVAACSPVSVALGSNGEVDVTGFQVGVSSSDNCTGFLFLTREISVDGGMNYNASHTFDCDDIGPNTVFMQVTDGSGNSASCSTTVTIQDNEAPSIDCPADRTVEWVDGMSLDAGDLGDTVVIDPAVPAGIFEGLASDNCEVTVDSSDFFPTPNGCLIDGFVFQIERTWTAEDGQGNTASCLQIITVVDTEAPTFTAPADADLDCTDGAGVANHLCETWTSVDVPVTILSVGTPTVTSDLTISLPNPTIITDVNVLDLQISHTFVGDLTITLTSPDGTPVTLMSGPCGNFDNIDIDFDDDGATNGTWPCPPTNGNAYEPNIALSAFIGEDLNGTWTLTISDGSTTDGGALQNWSLNICYVDQPGDLTETGDVTDEDDDCDTDPEATHGDYMAFKDFDDNLDFPRPNANYDFSPSTWSASVPPRTTATNDDLTLVGEDGGADADYSHFVPANGYISFDWDYMGTDGPMYDRFFVINDGVDVQITDDGDGNTQSGRAVIPVVGGTTFKFSHRSDFCCGFATTIITNFTYVDLSLFPEPANDCPRSFCIARLWDLEDDCGNDAATQVQLITTDDADGPEFTIPTDLTMLTGAGGCAPLIDLDFEADITDGCSLFDMWHTIDDGSDIPGADASSNYAPGVYIIEFFAADECGNIDSTELELTVIDNQTPFAVCFPAITVQLDNNGMATITPSSINNGSNDNCGLVDVSLSQTNFTTADIGVVPVTLTVEDAEGNSNSCTSLVTVLGGIIFDVQDASGPVGGMASPVVTATDFVQVTSFSMELNIVNTSVAVTTFPTQIGGITGINSALTTGGTFTFVVNSASKVTVNWFCNTPGCSLTLADGAPLFSLKTNLVGVLGNSTPVIINNDNVFTVPGGVVNPVPSIGLSGTITILGPGAFTISGSLLREANCTSPGGDVINNVQMNLTGSSSTPPSPILDADGNYSFSVPSGATATVSPFKDGTTGFGGSWFTGVNTFDVIAVNEHFLNITPITSPYKLIAADPNKSGSINIADVFIINQMALQSLPAGLNNTAWRFVDGSFTFPNPANPWQTVFPESATVNSIAANATRNFIGLKVGDVNCDANTNLLVGGGSGQSANRSESLPFLALDQNVNAGQDVTVAFLAKDFEGFKGYQTTVKFDPHALQFQSYQPGELPNLTEANLNPNEAGQGYIATNWFNMEAADLIDGAIVFTMTFKAHKNGLLSEMLTFNSEFIEAMAIKADGEVYGVDLVFDSPNAAGEARNDRFVLYQNSPNPFSSRTQIGFRLPQADHAVLTILDPSGRVLKIVENDYSAGYHEVNFERNDLPTSGVMFYQLETSTGRAVRKMVLLD